MQSESRGNDGWVWAAAGLLAAVALGLVIAQPGTAPERLAEPVVTQLASAEPVPTGTNAEARIERFRARMTAFQPFEALLGRAFGPLASLAPARSASRPAGRRVAPGASPVACLAQAVYFEARGEPAAGQAAVAQVVLNRTRSGAHPHDVCGVVFEGAQRPGCQFSFACDRRLGGRRLDATAWARARAVAADALEGREDASLRSALNYHADSVRPRWSARLRRAAEIGRHIFYAAVGPAAAPPAPPPPMLSE